MKKAIAVASLLAAAVLFLSGCASLSKDWDRATTQDDKWGQMKLKEFHCYGKSINRKMSYLTPLIP